MPGTIQVSVSLAPMGGEEAKTSPISSKIAMGKRVYQTMENGEFSFPLVSLRENMVLMLYNAEGNLIRQTEFKTTLVVEKGILDDEFCVEGGGILHVRVQFSLSEKDRMRIREMRNSALKRKHADLIKGSNEGDASDEVSNLTINPLLRDSKEHNEGIFQKDVPPQNQTNKGKANRESSAEGFQETVVSLGSNLDDEGSQYSASGEATKGSTSFSSELEDHVHGPRREKFLVRSSSNNITKMISAFESNVCQGNHVGPTKSFLSKRTSSEEKDLKNMIHQTMTKSFSSGMLSDVNLQDKAKDPRLVLMKMEERIENSNQADCGEAITNENQFSDSVVSTKVNNLGPDNQKVIEIKNNQSKHSRSLQSTQCKVSKSSTSVQTSIMTREATSLDASTEHVIEMENYDSHEAKRDPMLISIYKSSSVLMKLDVSQKDPNCAPVDDSKETLCERPFFSSEEQKDVFSTSEETFQDKAKFGSIKNEARRNSYISSGDRKGPGHTHIAYGTSENIISSRNNKDPPAFSTGRNVFNESRSKLDTTNNIGMKVDQNVKTVLEHDLLKEAPLSRIETDESVLTDDNSGLWMPQDDNSVYNGFFCGFCINNVKEQLAYGYLHESVGILYQRENFLLDAFGISVPHHICVTTGSKQLRNLLEHCSMCLGPLSVERNFSITASNEKQKMTHISSVEGMTTGKIGSSPANLNHEDSIGSSNLNGRLIDQGARIIIIIVACGTLLLSIK